MEDRQVALLCRDLEIWGAVGDFTVYHSIGVRRILRVWRSTGYLVMVACGIVPCARGDSVIS